MSKRIHRLTHIQIISLGYLVMIAVGTLLLALPIASASGQSVGFRTAFFTSTSASCVTGLILQPTAACWSFFGQAVILVLIQTGGLGFMTIAALFFIALNRRMGLRQRETMVESINLSRVDGIMKISRKILLGTLLFEGSGALLLSIRFIPLFGVGKGIWCSVFHSVSAFCNAGFDIMGDYGGGSSLTYFHGDPLVSGVIMLLIIIGGLGFIVWNDVSVYGFRLRRYSTHSKLVLTVTAVLVFGGALLFFFFEGNHTGADKSVPTRILEALFSSVTARTAGFNTVDTASLSGASKLLTIVWMFIGGSPGSTAGGIKTTTLVVLILTAVAHTRGVKRPHTFGRSIPDDAVRKSLSVFTINLTCALVSALVICGVGNTGVVDTLFETFSAIGTVGMSAGLTGQLSPLSVYIIALLMFIGRVGSVSFSMALLEKRRRAPVAYPEDEIIVG